MLSHLATATAAALPLVLVHDANFSPASWNWVRADLDVPATASSLRSSDESPTLAEVSDRLCATLAQASTSASASASAAVDSPAPAILVGLSQGGAIITEAAAHCPERVAALVYVAGVLPLPGEGVFDDRTLDDLNVSPPTQVKILAKTASTQVIALDSSHAPSFARHVELARILTGIRASILSKKQE